MSKAMIDDKHRFHAFLATQPLCKWMAQKKHEVAMGMHDGKSGAAAHSQPKNDNADLAAALSSMA